MDQIQPTGPGFLSALNSVYEEYRDPDAVGGSDPLYVKTPHASYCLGGNDEDSVAGWMAGLTNFINLVVFLIYLVRIRFLSQQMARYEDESRITTGDYALAIDDLDTTIP